MAEKKAILTIDEITPEREIVTVFGKDYELLDFEDLGLIKYSKFLKKYQGVSEQAQKITELDDTEYEAFDAALSEMVQAVLIGITPDVVAKIPIEKKQKVLTVFFTLATQKLTAKTEEAKKSITES
ncbi:MAG TPA: hypothetical protein PLH98_16415 [Ruminococcus flavefaciens]|nr:hypothetical protein [Ruminococcus flavefaciens]